jgi:hypothetical protein
MCQTGPASPVQSDLQSPNSSFMGYNDALIAAMPDDLVGSANNVKTQLGGGLRKRYCRLHGLGTVFSSSPYTIVGELGHPSRRAGLRAVRDGGCAYGPRLVKVILHAWAVILVHDLGRVMIGSTLGGAGSRANWKPPRKVRRPVYNADSRHCRFQCAIGLLSKSITIGCRAVVWHHQRLVTLCGRYTGIPSGA